METNNTQTELNNDAPTAMEVGTRFGFMLTVISILLFLIPALTSMNPFKGPWNWIGLGFTVAIMYLAHKKFKDEGNGFMSYSQGVAIAAWIAAISTVVSMIFYYGYISFIDNGPFELFMIQQEDEMIANGTPDSVIETSLEWTRKLFWIIGIVMGLIFNLIVGLVLTIFTKNQIKEAPF